jgi:hypothetical protein
MTKKTIGWILIAVAAFVAVLLVRNGRRLRQPVAIEGAVVESNPDTRKERPIEGVEITASDGVQSAMARSDASGYFKVILQKRLLSGRSFMLGLRHSNYEPLDVSLPVGRLYTRSQLYVEKMLPVATAAATGPHHAQAVVSDVRVRYTSNARTETDVGSAVKTFQVVNTANVPCNGHSPCSPDKRWKATSGSESLDAGAGNVFHNVRASCIAGPCGFTTIDASGSPDGVRSVRISALNWSEPATFLIEAEVYRAEIGSRVRELYPVIFGRGLNFTMPPTAEGVSIEAEIDGSQIIFPLSPYLDMSWATCTVRAGAEPEKVAVYRCELKPDYRFQTTPSGTDQNR